MDFFNFGETKKGVSSGSNLVKPILPQSENPKISKKEELIKQIDAKQIKFFSIKTTCGEFQISWENKERISVLLLTHLLKILDKSTTSFTLNANRLDHSMFKHIFRYIQYGIELNSESLSKSMNISPENVKKLASDWGYDIP